MKHVSLIDDASRDDMLVSDTQSWQEKRAGFMVTLLTFEKLDGPVETFRVTLSGISQRKGGTAQSGRS